MRRSKIRQPQDGANIKLTIDSTVQKVAEDALKEAIDKHHAEGGTVLVMQPDTGEVLGMASWPTFDPNTYVDLDPALYNHNPAMNNLYEPGSTFKVLLTAMGLQTNSFTADTTVSDVGSIQRYGYTLHNWNSAGIGATTPQMMLYRSSNVAALQFGEKVGREKFYQYVKAFGYGEPTNIDLAGEESGIVNWPIGDNWSDLTLDQNSFGQGIAVTPLQHLTAISAVANGGKLMWPHVVRERCTGNSCATVQPKVVRQVVDQERDRPDSRHADQKCQPVCADGLGPARPAAIMICRWSPVIMYARRPVRRRSPSMAATIIMPPSARSSAGLRPSIRKFRCWSKSTGPKDDIWGVGTAIPVYQKVVSQLLPYFNVAPDPALMDPVTGRGVAPAGAGQPYGFARPLASPTWGGSAYARMTMRLGCGMNL